MNKLPIFATVLLSVLCCGCAAAPEQWGKLTSARNALARSDELQSEGKIKGSLAKLKQAAALGLPVAQAELAERYANGKDVPQDLAKAERLLRKAASADTPVYTRDLACVLYRQRDPGKRTEAAALMADAAHQGDVPAMLHLSRFLKFGIGREKDLVMAGVYFDEAVRRLYTRPVRQDHAAQHQRVLLGPMLAHPRCGPVDLESADKADAILERYRNEERLRATVKPSHPARREKLPRLS